MKEIKDILEAYKAADKEGKQTALATVVHVEGSSYRRPGARMLVTEDGQLTGAISGGCLEGDALRKALLAITQQQNKLVTYDTTDEDDAKFGVQLGCNGIVHILFEPIRKDAAYNPVMLLEQLTGTRQNAVLVTLFCLSGTIQPGTSLLYRYEVIESALSATLKEQILSDAEQALLQKTSFTKLYVHEQQQLNAFVEFVAPPVAIVIAGAGNDVWPLVEITKILGWHTTVVDGRPTHATLQRFSSADRVLVAKAGEVLANIKTDERTVFVLMTHNYNYDLELLSQLLKHDVGYVGTLGPKKKLERMLDDLETRGEVMSEGDKKKIFGPVGLDIGAETAEEIAVSIVAEIKAVLEGRAGTSLREKESSIHGHSIVTF